MIKVDCDDGKYTFIVDNNTNGIPRTEIKILRFRQEWWDDQHPTFPWKAIHSLIYKCEQQENKIKELEDQLYSVLERCND
jgi:hypothetical protein